MPPPQGPLPHGRNGMQYFYPGPADAGNWRPAPPRRIESAILLGLWLLVMLAAVAIGMRMLDLSAVAAPPVQAPPRPLASDDAADSINTINTVRSAVLAARPRESDPFDDAPPDLSPAPPPVPEPVPAQQPVMAARPVPIAPAAALAVEPPAAPLPAPAAPQASRGPVCDDALRAMQLCPDMK